MRNSIEDLPALIAFSHPKIGIGFKRVLALDRAGLGATEVWESLAAGGVPAQLRKAWPEKVLERARKRAPQVAVRLDDLLADMLRDGVVPISYWHSSYPDALKQLPSPPLVLYIRGGSAPEDRLRELCEREVVVMVGTRNCSAGAREIAREVSGALGAAGAVTCSGLALGIDQEVHAASAAGGWPTIAVLAGGVDDASVTPRRHLGLAQELMSEGGLLVSEFPPGTTPLPRYFPQRNRIVAGLSRATVVVEAPEKSGALITARFALESNRDVWAVPSSPHQMSNAGGLKLLAEGAHPLISTAYFLEALDMSLPDDVQSRLNRDQYREGLSDELSEEARSVASFLTADPLPVDLIQDRCELPVSMFLQAITELEMLGLVTIEHSTLFLTR